MNDLKIEQISSNLIPDEFFWPRGLFVGLGRTSWAILNIVLRSWNSARLFILEIKKLNENKTFVSHTHQIIVTFI